jgi:prepilin-type N-terminal cleavage/methylation domain-containing protein
MTSAIGANSDRLDEPRRPANFGFTLVEVVIVLTIIGLMVGMAIPTIEGVLREREARVPVSELLRLARTVRQRAIEEQVPYQIAFDGTGFHAARFFNPYGEAEEFAEVVRDMEEMERRREMIQASQERNGVMSEPSFFGLGGDGLGEVLEGQQGLASGAAATGNQSSIYYENYELPDGVDYELLFWGRSEWTPMQSGRFERWVFQPSGICLPLKIRVSADDAFFEVEFHPLTADVKSESGWVE